MRLPFADAWSCENHPNARVRVATVVVLRDGVQTCAATSDWQLSAALVKAALS